MITGIDYILYTNKNRDAFIEKIKESVTFWEDPYIVIDNEDEITDIFVSRDEETFQLMDEKGFYVDELSGEGSFLLIFNSGYSLKENRVTLVLPEEIDKSKFSKLVFNSIKSIL